MRDITIDTWVISMVDPGFQEDPGGGANIDFAKYSKNCMKIRKFWAVCVEVRVGGDRHLSLNPM